LITLTGLNAYIGNAQLLFITRVEMLPQCWPTLFTSSELPLNSLITNFITYSSIGTYSRSGKF